MFACISGHSVAAQGESICCNKEAHVKACLYYVAAAAAVYLLVLMYADKHMGISIVTVLVQRKHHAMTKA